MNFNDVSKKKFAEGRKAFMAVWLKRLEQMLPDSGNVEMYTKLLNNYSDEEFGEMIKMMQEGKLTLPVIAPNLKDIKVENSRLEALGKELGHSFYQNITITDQKDTDVTIQTPKRAMVVRVPIRRQLQTGDNKLGVPTHADVIDDSTGQVTGDSKGGAMSLAETRNLEAKGLDSVVYEYLSPLGGNNEAYQIMEDLIIEKGNVTIDEIQTDERPAVIDTVDVLFSSAHIKGNW